MRALEGRIPRAFTSHKSPEGWAYAAYCRGKLARFGKTTPPPDAKPTMREAGKVNAELERLSRLEEVARAKNRKTEARRLRREIGRLRGMFRALDERLDLLLGNGDGKDLDILAELAKQRPVE